MYINGFLKHVNDVTDVIILFSNLVGKKYFLPYTMIHTTLELHKNVF